MSDDTPTQRLPQAPDGGGELVEERKKSRALLFVLIGVGAALLIAISVLLTLLLTSGGGDPQPSASASETPSATPTTSESPTPSATPSTTPSVEPVPTATAAPPPAPAPDTAPGFASFTQGQTVSCNSTNPPGYVTPGITFSYTAKNASSVWFLFGEGDAADAQAFPMPISGSQNDVYGAGTKVEYPCGAATAKFTLTVVGTNGQHVNKTFTVTNNGDVY